MNTFSHDDRKKTAAECSVYVFYCLVLSLAANCFFPTNPKGAHLHIALMSGLAVLLLIVAAWPRAVLSRNTRIIRIIAMTIIALPLGVDLYMMHCMSIGTFIISSFKAAIFYIIVVSTAIVVLFVLMLYRKVSGRVFRLAFFSAVFINSIIAVPQFYFLWKSPSDQECKANVIPGVVDRITPQSFPDSLSYPYGTMYLPDKNMVVVTFKMAGNLLLSPWNVAGANRIVVVGTPNGKKQQVSYLTFSDGMMPENIAWNPQTDTIYLTHVGYGRYSLSSVSLASFPVLKTTDSIPLDYEPNSVLISDDYDALWVIGIDGIVGRFKPRSLAEIKPRRNNKASNRSIMAVSRMPGTNKAYLGHIGLKTTEYDLLTGKKREANTSLFNGAASSDIVPQSGMLYQTDAISGRLSVIDTNEMKLLNNIKLGYKPRPVKADYSRDLLIVSDWFAGSVHFYSLSTLRQLYPPAPVGKYLRSFAYDHENNLLYVSCKCGLYRVDVSQIAENNRASHRRR